MNTESAIDIFRLFMRACLLCGMSLLTLEAVPRSAAEFKEAAAHFDRSVELSSAPAWQAESSRLADWCRSRAEAL